jgi:hypothetical protein
MKCYTYNVKYAFATAENLQCKALSQDTRGLNILLSRNMDTIVNKSPFIHSSVICHTTGPQPLPKRFLHLMRSRASSFK